MRSFQVIDENNKTIFCCEIHQGTWYVKKGESILKLTALKINEINTISKINYIDIYIADDNINEQEELERAIIDMGKIF